MACKILICNIQLMQPPCSRLYRRVRCCFTKSNWTPLRIHCMLSDLHWEAGSFQEKVTAWSDTWWVKLCHASNGFQPYQLYPQAFGLDFLVSEGGRFSFAHSVGAKTIKGYTRHWKSLEGAILPCATVQRLLGFVVTPLKLEEKDERSTNCL